MRLKTLKQQIDQLFIDGKANCPITIRTKDNQLLSLHIIGIKAGKTLQEGEVLLMVDEQLNIRLKDKNNQYYCSGCGHVIEDKFNYCPNCGERIKK